jgi:hypothetical protein
MGLDQGAASRTLSYVRIWRFLVVALLIVGCAGPEAPVPLLTGVDPAIGPNTDECWLNNASGVLSVDPTYGTAINNDAPFHSFTMPVMWRPGFKARSVNGHIEVLDPTGTVVAVTGRKYVIPGAATRTLVHARLGDIDVTLAGVAVWWSCGKVGAR